LTAVPVKEGVPFVAVPINATAPVDVADEIDVETLLRTDSVDGVPRETRAPDLEGVNDGVSAVADI
jgi:hypothetical protein